MRRSSSIAERPMLSSSRWWIWCWQNTRASIPNHYTTFEPCSTAHNASAGLMDCRINSSPWQHRVHISALCHSGLGECSKPYKGRGILDLYPHQFHRIHRFAIIQLHICHSSSSQHTFLSLQANRYLKRFFHILSRFLSKWRLQAFLFSWFPYRSPCSASTNAKWCRQCI